MNELGDYFAVNLPMDEMRRRMEATAESFCDGEGGGSWTWDETKMHLTIWHSDGKSFATIHVELTQ